MKQETKKEMIETGLLLFLLFLVLFATFISILGLVDIIDYYKNKSECNKYGFDEKYKASDDLLVCKKEVIRDGRLEEFYIEIER